MPINFIPTPQTEEVQVTSKWGDITGVLENQSDLVNSLSNKSNLNHNHDLEYEQKNPVC